VLADLLPHAEVVEHAEGVALQRDPGAERLDAVLGVDHADRDTGLREEGGGGDPGDAGADDEDLVHSGHDCSFARRVAGRRTLSPAVAGRGRPVW